MKSIATLAGSAGSAQLISILTLPIIGRAYGPASFGEYSVAVVVVTLASVVFSFQFHQALILPSDDVEASRLLRCTGLTSTIGVVLILFVAAVVASLGYSVGSIELVVLTALAAWTMPMGLALQSWMVRKARIKAIALIAIAKVLVVASAQLLLAAITTDSWGMMLGFLLGDVAAIALAMSRCRGDLQAGIKLFGWEPECFSRYKDFAVYGTSQELINSVSQGVPTVLLGALLGPHVAGAYAMAVKVTVGPSNILGNAIRNTVSPLFAKSNQDELSRYLRSWTAALSLSVLIPAAAAFLWAGDVIAWMLGDGWIKAAEYAGWLSLWAVMLVVNAPSTVALRVARRQREAAFYNLIVLVARIGVIAVGASLIGDYLTVAAFAVTGVALNVGMIIYTKQLVSSRH